MSGRAFKRHNQAKKTWKEARKACQAEGGDLVVDDNQAIRNWMNSQGSDLWIGASDEVWLHLIHARDKGGSDIRDNALGTTVETKQRSKHI